jgi:hypothetical protein
MAWADADGTVVSHASAEQSARSVFITSPA